MLTPSVPSRCEILFDRADQGVSVREVLGDLVRLDSQGVVFGLVPQAAKIIERLDVLARAACLDRRSGRAEATVGPRCAGISPRQCLNVSGN